jgi:hypothetical protein
LPTQAAGEQFGRSGITQQTLRDKNRMLGIVADQAAPEDQPMSPVAFEQALNPLARQPFGG